LVLVLVLALVLVLVLFVPMRTFSLTQEGGNLRHLQLLP
jgi:hypothetical protein